MPPQWGSYVTVSDLAAALDKVRELGGNVLMPATPIEGLGQIAVIQDPQGAVIQLFEFA